jgi:polyisoprenoid-binding protein YceI
MNLFFASAFFLATFFGAETELKIKSDDVKINFVVDADHAGSIGGFEATIHFDASDLTNSTISGTVDANTINTDNAKRDTHLKSADYLDAEKYPKMGFKSTSITAGDNGFVMTGLMSIKDVEREETITFGFADNTFTGKSTISLSHYKIGGYAKKKPEDSQISISFVVPVM